MRRIPAVLAVLFCVLLLCCCSGNVPLKAQYNPTSYTLTLSGDEVESDVPWVVNLTKDPAEDFVILAITDIQLGGTDYRLNFDHIERMVTALVEKVNPDLIAITGDFSYGNWNTDFGICSFIDSFGIPWAPVYGNHDFEDSGMSPDTLAEVFECYSNCVFRDGPALLAVDTDTNVEAHGNYVVNIIEKQADTFKVCKSLVFFNSRTVGITDYQMQWYQDCMDSVSAYMDTRSSAVFMHIPIPEYRDAALVAYKNHWASLKESYTSEAWNTGYESSFGAWHEGIGYRETKSGYADILKTKGNDLLVCGHNHTNCFCIDYDGMKYVYVLKTGPGCYYEKGMEGGTEITVSSSGDVTVRNCFFYEGHGCYYTPQDFI